MEQIELSNLEDKIQETKAAYEEFLSTMPPKETATNAFKLFLIFLFCKLKKNKVSLNLICIEYVFF